MWFLFFFLICFARAEWICSEKRYNNKLVRYIYRDDRNSSSVGYIYLDGGLDLYFADLNNSRSIITRKYNNLEYIVGPKGSKTTQPALKILEKQEFIRTYNTTFRVVVANNNDYMIISGFLHNCGAPLVTHINIQTFVLFNGTDVYTSDQSMRSDATVHDAELYSLGSYQILVKANSFQNYTIQLLQNYEITQESVVYPTRPSLNGTFQFGVQNYTFVKYRTGELIPPVIPTEVGFTKNVLRPFYYFSRSCDADVGGYDANLLLKYPYTPEAVPRGGYCPFTTGELPAIPVAIPPNPLYKPYRDDCNQFYPKGPKFLAFLFTTNDGAEYNRLKVDQNRCYSPFFAPELIVQGNVEKQDERFDQCFMLGGELAGVGQDVCARNLAWAKCKAGLYFGDFCYYKFNSVKEAYAKVILEESTQVCESLGASLGLPVGAMVPLSYANYYQQAWLIRNFVYSELDGGTEINTQFRVPVFNTVCSCYSAASSATGDNTTDCGCNTPAFPICLYHIKHYKVIDSDISHHPITIKILRDGQSGSPWVGQEFNCICLNGYTGKACQNVTCGYPVSVQTDNPLAIFFTKCYANNRGECQDADPRACACWPGYTPPGNLITGENVDFPCACPGIPRAGLALINNVTYQMQEQACGGILQGVCDVDDFTNAGECTCATRIRLASTFNLEVEKAFDGKSCAARVPRIFTETDIQQQLCNGKGTACPFGERSDGSTAYCPPGFYGCLCDNGFTGEACTCEAPFDLTSLLPFNTPTQVKFINCSSSMFLLDSLPHDCVLIENNKYYCGENRFVSKITNCTSLNSVYNSWFDTCGNNTNPSAGRYSARKENRYYNHYLELQPWEYATKGCTNSKCMCDSSHTGAGCFMGISNTVTKALCGETTLPQRGVPDEETQKCKCSPFGENGYFYEDSCECFVKNGKTCNGHGTCETVDFPYGTCSGLLHLNDSLNQPFYTAPVNLSFNVWKFQEQSILTNLASNQSYYFRDAFTSVYLYKVYGSEPISTCDSSIKMILPIVMTDALVELVTFNLTLASGATVVSNTLRAYAACAGLNQTTFYNGTITRPNCYVSYEVILSGTTESLSAAEELYELTCVTAVTISPLQNYPYGKLNCNNVYQRNIDKALWIYLGEGNYTLQCQNEPIAPYDTPDFYGLFHAYNATRVALALGNKKVPLSELNEKFFDNYLISWVSPYVNTSLVNVNYGSLQTAVQFPDVDNQILSIVELYTTGVMYDFLDERWFFSNASGIGSPVRPLPYFAPNNTSPYDLFLLARNYSAFYRMPGIIVTLPSYRREYRNATNLLNTTQVNSLLFKPPVNLAWASIYARNGTLCGHVPYPRANKTYTVSCGFDPFLVDAEYYQWLHELEIKANQSDEAGDFSITSIFALLSGLTMEGVRVNIVPENFYGIELSASTTGPSGSFALPGYEDHCIPSDGAAGIDFMAGLNGTCHSFNGTATFPNFAWYYYNNWATTQGWNPAIASNNTSPFIYWFDLAFIQTLVTNYDQLWATFKDLPLNPLVNSSLPALDCVADETYCLAVWHTWLSPPNCTFDSECVNNALGSKCVFSDADLPTVGWRNGNGQKSLGIEGGCKCDFSFETGFWVEFCDSCEPGYGPFGNCSFPTSFEQTCGPGGVGYVVTKEEETVSLQIIGNKIPACNSLVYNGVNHAMIASSFVYIKQNSDFLVSYENDSSIINVINDIAYLDGNVIEPECVKYEDDEKFFIQYLGLEFVPWLSFLSFAMFD